MSNHGNRTLAVNNPGGQARQFRVQIQTDVSGYWKHSAVFSKRQFADQRVQELRDSGLQARVVHFRLPTAA